MTAHCPHCGQPVPESAPGGLCPACMLKVGASATGEADPGGTVPESAPSAPPAAEEIARLFPQLEILGCLGRGGMGAVYQARQPRLDRMVALKILLPGPGVTAQDPAVAERFAREARALARLNHPNIVTVYDFGEAGGFLYLLMEYVDGTNLRQMLRGGKLAPEAALAIVPRVCEALQYAHDQGVVHRDIKPENILVDQAGRVKIADFGIAKLLRRQPGEDTLTREHHVIGTPHYMAPEQVEHPLAVDHRADIYSLGVVFYEMLTGELPLGKFAPPSRKVKVDVRLDEVVLHAMEKEPARRYQHASEVKTDIEGLSRAAALPAAAEPARKRRRVLLVYGLLCCAVGLPAGLALDLPFVTMLSAIGLIAAALKLSGRWPFPTLFANEQESANLPPVPAGQELTPGQMVLLYAGFTCCIFLLGAAALRDFPPLFRAFLALLSLICLGLLVPSIVLRRRIFPPHRTNGGSVRSPGRRSPLYWVVTLLVAGFGLLTLIALILVGSTVMVNHILPAIRGGHPLPDERAPAVYGAMPGHPDAGGDVVFLPGTGTNAGAAVYRIGPALPRPLGPEHVVTLAGAGDAHPRFLDLDLGRQFAAAEFAGPSAESDPEATAAWCRQHGIDLMAEATPADGALVGWDMAIVPVQPPDWDLPDTTRLDQLLHTASPIPQLTLPTDPRGSPAYAFRTREGSIGMLQILPAPPDATPPAVSVRYKVATGEDGAGFQALGNPPRRPSRGISP